MFFSYWNFQVQVVIETLVTLKMKPNLFLLDSDLGNSQTPIETNKKKVACKFTCSWQSSAAFKALLIMNMVSDIEFQQPFKEALYSFFEFSKDINTSKKWSYYKFSGQVKKKYNKKVLTSIFSFFATESQSFAAIPVLQSRFTLTSPPPGLEPSTQKQAR